MTKAVFSGFELMVESHPLIKHEALPVPTAVLFGHLLEIAEDAAAQVVDFSESPLLQIAACFFTSNAARAEHGDPLLTVLFQKRFQVLLGPPGKVAEAFGAGIN